jgi:hypothetical protein
MAAHAKADNRYLADIFVCNHLFGLDVTGYLAGNLQGLLESVLGYGKVKSVRPDLADILYDHIN